MVLDFVYSKISVWQIYLPPVACTGIRQRGVKSCGGDQLYNIHNILELELLVGLPKKSYCSLNLTGHF